MTPAYTTPHTLIYMRPLPDDSAPRSGRAAAEREAVHALVREVFGAEAVYDQHADGAPFIQAQTATISISHGAGMAVLAVSPQGHIGVDVETWRPQLERIRSRYLSAQEQAAYATPEALLRAWTAKEAVFKAARLQGATLSSVTLTTAQSAIITHNGTTRRFSLSFFGSFPTLIALAEPDFFEIC